MFPDNLTRAEAQARAALIGDRHVRGPRRPVRARGGRPDHALHVLVADPLHRAGGGLAARRPDRRAGAVRRARRRRARPGDVRGLAAALRRHARRARAARRRGRPLQPQRRRPAPLRRPGRRADLPLHAVRAGRRPPGVRLLRAARPQGAVLDLGRRARRTGPWSPAARSRADRTTRGDGFVLHHLRHHRAGLDLPDLAARRALRDRGRRAGRRRRGTIAVARHLPPLAGREPGHRRDPRGHPGRVPHASSTTSGCRTPSASTTRPSSRSTTPGAMENIGLVTLRDEYVFRSRVTQASRDYRRGGDPARARAHVVRRPGDHALVGRPVAQGVLRHLVVELRRRRADRRPVGHTGPRSAPGPRPARCGPTSCPRRTRSRPTSSTSRPSARTSTRSPTARAPRCSPSWWRSSAARRSSRASGPTSPSTPSATRAWPTCSPRSSRRRAATCTAWSRALAGDRRRQHPRPRGGDRRRRRGHRGRRRPDRRRPSTRRCARTGWAWARTTSSTACSPAPRAVELDVDGERTAGARAGRPAPARAAAAERRRPDLRQGPPRRAFPRDRGRAPAAGRRPARPRGGLGLAVGRLPRRRAAGPRLRRRRAAHGRRGDRAHPAAERAGAGRRSPRTPTPAWPSGPTCRPRSSRACTSCSARRRRVRTPSSPSPAPSPRRPTRAGAPTLLAGWLEGRDVPEGLVDRPRPALAAGRPAGPARAHRRGRHRRGAGPGQLERRRRAGRRGPGRPADRRGQGRGVAAGLRDRRGHQQRAVGDLRVLRAARAGRRPRAVRRALPGDGRGRLGPARGVGDEGRGAAHHRGAEPLPGARRPRAVPGPARRLARRRRRCPRPLRRIVVERRADSLRALRCQQAA